MARHIGEGAEISVKASLDIRSQHLDGDSAWRAGRIDLGAMHLRDRGGGDRRTEACIDRMERSAKGCLDRGHRLALGKRRHLILQPLKIVGESGADHVGPRRQELAELYITGPQPGQGDR